MNEQADFVHLHNHTQYSLLDGACKINELVELTREFGQPAVAITDHGNLFGAVEFHKAAKAADVKPIIGCEVYVSPHSRLEKQDARGIRIHGERAYHLILLAENDQGYRNLVKLVSLAYLEGFHYRPRVDHELLEKYAGGLIALSACIGGEVPSHLLHGNREKAEEVAGRYREIFGPDNFYLELQDHGMPEQAETNPQLIALARKLDSPLVATNDCHYLKAEHSKAHDILLCIQTGKVLNEPDRLRFPSGQFYVKSPDEMRVLFSAVPEALVNTVRIAERCNFDFIYGTYHLPVFEVPEGQTLDQHFEEKVRQGFDLRLPAIKARLARTGDSNGLEEYQQRLQMEIEVITRMKFSGYFLIIWDVIHQARLKGIAVGPGRGSAVGSLVSYCLKITDLDPLEYNLLFERFLNPDRVSMPDIDIDFCQRRRDEAIEHVRNKYGSKNVAQIITFGTLKARQTIRDVGRVQEVPYAEVDRIAKMIPLDLKATIEKALQEPELKKLYESEEHVRDLLDVAKDLEGLARHASKHAAGIVIAPREITEFCPLYRMTNGDVLTQFTMNHAEAIGLLKMDFLGLRTLTVIEDTLENIRLGGQVPPDLSSLTLDDPDTYQLLCEARTGGIFQFEKGGAQDILRRLHPDCFEDLIAVNALNRPGPLQGGMVDDFINRRHGQRQNGSLLPQIEDILKETYGILVYQEQVMRIVRAVAGFSMGEADDLRKAMSKKNQVKMGEIAVKFLEGAAGRKINRSKAQNIWNLIAKFGEYGFNKSHSTAYALLAYQTAYLKTHFAVPFMAALLTSEKNAPDKMVEYLAECRDMGIRILPPDINESGMNFSVSGDKIRFGLSAVKNVGESAIESILDARRKQGGRFKSFFQFFEVVDLRLNNRRVLESLIRCGGFDSFGFHRAQLWIVLDRAMEAGQRRQIDIQQGQHSLFGDAGESASHWPDEAQQMPDVEPWPEGELLGYEKELLGYFVTGHPLQKYGDILARFATADSRRLSAVADTEEAVAMGGIVSALSLKKTRKGDSMATFILEDLEGRNEVVVFPKAFEECKSSLVKDRPVMVLARTERSESRVGAAGEAGRDEAEEENIRLLALKIFPLETAPEQLARAVTISICLDRSDGNVLERLRPLLAGHSGKVPVQFVFALPEGRRVTMRPSAGYFLKPTPDITRQLEAILGQGSVFYHPGKIRLSDWQQSNSWSDGNHFGNGGSRGWG
jgi:DNA polymerase-3 subunit alpha